VLKYQTDRAPGVWSAVFAVVGAAILVTHLLKSRMRGF
jgi:hypothetical protein